LSLKSIVVSGITAVCLCFNALAAPKRTPEPARAFSACAYQLNDPEKICTPIEINGVKVNKNADVELAPASLNKMMTAHLLLKHMASKGHKLDDPFTYVSREDAEIGRTGERNKQAITDGRTLRYRKSRPDLLKGLPEDHVFTYRDFISAMLVFSANDFTAAAARLIALDGKQETFARMMTDEGKAIGLKDTEFKTASGMPWPGQHTTAEDMSTLVHHLVKTYGTDQFNSMFGQPSAIIAGIEVPGHIRLIQNGAIAGGKSGFDNGGASLAGSVERGNYGIAFSTLGSPNGRTRDSFTKSMLDRIFNALIPSATAKEPVKPTQPKPKAAKKKPAAKAPAAANK